jgi:hypothetical protein
VQSHHNNRKSKPYFLKSLIACFSENVNPSQIILEYRLPADPAGYHMVQRSGSVYAGSAWHDVFYQIKSFVVSECLKVKNVPYFSPAPSSYRPLFVIPARHPDGNRGGIQNILSSHPSLVTPAKAGGRYIQ